MSPAKKQENVMDTLDKPQVVGTAFERSQMLGFMELLYAVRECRETMAKDLKEDTMTMSHPTKNIRKLSVSVIKCKFWS